MPRYEYKIALAAWIEYHITAISPKTADDENPLKPADSSPMGKI